MREPFIEEEVLKVPEESGIFTLFQERDPVYIGRTAPRSNLRKDLLHALAVTMADDMMASHFSFELTKAPKTRATEELRSYYEAWGRLPVYNQPHGLPLGERAELRR
ncbi:MAG TPA: hypothetical protein VN675_01490 [Burkholderiales bacterium]|nr:hypothetical protein [Burkholderiales bacterium]